MMKYEESDSDHLMELTIEQVLQRAVAAHKEGKLQEAEHFYRTILKSQPSHPDANHNLGILALSVNLNLDSKKIELQVYVSIITLINQTDLLIRLYHYFLNTLYQWPTIFCKNVSVS